MVSGAQAKMRPSAGKEINVMNEQAPILDRLDDQISWYDRKSQSAQKRYKVLKLVQVVAAALLPLLPCFRHSAPGESLGRAGFGHLDYRNRSAVEPRSTEPGHLSLELRGAET